MSISVSIDFVTKQYDTVMLELKSLREERHENVKYIKQLVTKNENLERKYKSSNLDIKNVVINIVIKTGIFLSLPVQAGDV